MVDTSKKSDLTAVKITKAESIIEKQNDIAQARELYKEVFEKLKEGGSGCIDDLIFLAGSVSNGDFLNDKQWTREILGIAASTADRSTDFYTISKAVEEFLNDKTWAKRIEEEGDGWRDAEDDAMSWR
ncbi:MAG: hypothetical protein P9L95_03675 [Candidatus Tenebribacter mawsonii]|nr:hypothetical protein [Candidatus Tenebribacter mawsonii]